MATQLRGGVVDRLIDALQQVEGAYSLVALAQDMVIGVRDPLGVRPLVLGRLGDGPYPGLGDLRARHHRRRASSATSSPASSSSSTAPASIRCAPSPPRRAASASSNTSTSPGPTASSRAAASTRRASASAPSWPARARRAGRCRDPGARFRRARGASAMPPRPAFPSSSASSATTMSGRTFIEPTRPHPPSRREAEAQRQPRHARGQARGPGRRQHRARHHQPEDRRDGAQRRRHGGAYAHLQPADHPFLLLRHRHAGAQPAARRHSTTSRRWPRSSASTASPSSPSTASTAPWASRAAMPQPAAILRRLLHRRLSDPPDRPGRRRAGAALAARRDRPETMAERPARRARRARHRRLARHRARPSPSASPQRAPS